MGRVIFTRSLSNPHEVLGDPAGDLKAIRILKREDSDKTSTLFFQSTPTPGTVTFSTNKGLTYTLSFYSCLLDIDKDGFPDSAELDSSVDKASFIAWFVRIAESQYLKKNYSWNRSQRDCAGLIRYAFKEALKKHDQKWQNDSGIVIDKNLPDVKKYNFPDVPVIGERIFKIKSGPADDPASFGHFADAGTLDNLNTRFVSKDIKDVQKGDILFFRDDTNVASPYHSMIVVKAKGNDIILIYHTGSKADVIKRIDLSYLQSSNKFRPVGWNKYFLGVHRFLILE